MPTLDAAGSDGAAAILFRGLGLLDVEELWVLCLDDDYRAVSLVRVERGDEREIQVDTDRVLCAVREAGVRSYVFCHNHPGGVPLPSLADWAATALLLRESDAAGLDCVDHLVLGDWCYASLREMSPYLFERYEREEELP